MSKALQVDDLEVGMTVTVFKGAVTEKRSGGLSELVVGTITRENDYGKGSVLKIKAIDIPYIILSHVNYPTLEDTQFDLRKTKFGTLSDDYIKASIRT